MNTRVYLRGITPHTRSSIRRAKLAKESAQKEGPEEAPGRFLLGPFGPYHLHKTITCTIGAQFRQDNPKKTEGYHVGFSEEHCFHVEEHIPKRKDANLHQIKHNLTMEEVCQRAVSLRIAFWKTLSVRPFMMLHGEHSAHSLSKVSVRQLPTRLLVKRRDWRSVPKRSKALPVSKTRSLSNTCFGSKKGPWVSLVEPLLPGKEFRRILSRMLMLEWLRLGECGGKKGVARPPQTKMVLGKAFETWKVAMKSSSQVKTFPW